MKAWIAILFTIGLVAACALVSGFLRFNLAKGSIDRGKEKCFSQGVCYESIADPSSRFDRLTGGLRVHAVGPRANGRV
jgi:predicted hydrolase (HD superfamily)